MTRWPTLLLRTTVSIGLAGSAVALEELTPRQVALAARLVSAKPIADLPQHVCAPPGQLTLYADFSDTTKDGIALYVINTTDDSLSFTSDDEQLLVRLEAEQPDGTWVRAQKYFHIGCISERRCWPLGPGEYFFFRGRYPSDGKACRVRYKLYPSNVSVGDPAARRRKDVQAMSNVGIGRVSAEDVREAKYDHLALKYGSFEVISEMALRRVPSGRMSEHLQNEAIGALSRFPNESSVDLLERILETSEPRQQLVAVRALASVVMQNATLVPRVRPLVMSCSEDDDNRLSRTAAYILELLPDIVGWGDMVRGLQLRATLPGHVELNMPVNVSVEIKSSPNWVPPNIRVFSPCYDMCTFFSLQLSNVHTGEAFTVNADDRAHGPPPADGPNILLDGSIAGPWPLTFALVRAEPAIAAGVYDCTVHYTQPRGPKPQWFGSDEEWDDLGAWFGTIASASVKLEIIPEKPGTKSGHLP